MNWLRLDVTIIGHPKVALFAQLTGSSIDVALARTVRFLCGVAVHAEDGDLANIPDVSIAEWVQWKKPAAELVTALVSAGLMEQDRQVHGWLKRHQYMINERKRKIEISEARKADRDARRAERVDEITSDGAQMARAQKSDGARASRVLRANGAHPTSPLLSSSIKQLPSGTAPPPGRRPNFFGRYETAYEAHFGRRPSEPKWKQAGALFRTAKKRHDEAVIESLIPAYFELASCDPFHEGAPITKFLMGETLDKLFASQAKRNGGQGAHSSLADRVFADLGIQDREQEIPDDAAPEPNHDASEAIP